jgi:hypothetical protein
MNAVEIEEAISLLADQPFDPAEFPYSFLEAFGNKETTIKRLKTGNNNKSDIERGVLQHNNIHIAVADEGKVIETLKNLRESPATTKAKVKFILATDGKDFQAEDINSGESIASDYPAFHNHFGFFLPLAGISTVKQIRENAFDIKATSRLNKLYIELLRHNPEWATIERRHDMNHFLARLIFCFFAEDTGIFAEEGLFTDTVHKMSAGDASDTHEVIAEIFRAMDIKSEERVAKKVKSWANVFPYVNGQLFSGSTDTPKFTKIARSYLLHVGSLDWKKINPDIFGSMIQAVADDDERGALGMHYTSVPNILKLLNPLLLDDVRAQLEEAGDNARKLLNLRKRISRIRVFDPACGSGNFLVIAYKQLREIEYEINNRRGEVGRSSEILLTNFRGIELRDFSAEVARLALIIAEYQCDVLYRGQKLALAEFLPLNAENWITCGNALRIDWLSLCPPSGLSVKVHGSDLFSAPADQAEIDFENEGGETYICGNPPYLGTREQEKHHKDDLKNVFQGRDKNWKSLDYVAAWFVKAAEFGRHNDVATAFVATNSICQGQHVPILWPLIFKTGHEISFAHTSFRWSNLASHNAGVTVVIVGISKQKNKAKRLFSISHENETTEKRAENINAYLINAPNIYIHRSTIQISNLPEMLSGDKLTDGGNLVLSFKEKVNLLKAHPKAEKIIGRLIGGQELIKGIVRFALIISDEDVEYSRSIPYIKSRLDSVAKMRQNSTKKATQSLAKYPHRFDETRFENVRKFVIAQLSSEKREYYPCELVKENDVAMAASLVIYDSTAWIFGILSSHIHLVWIATVCGKMKTDYRYSNTLGWNTFPIPRLTMKNKEDLSVCAQEILIARERHFPATIADLYDPELMPEDLRRAHERNDEVLERIYIGRRFKNDSERLEKLFELYTRMTNKLQAV